MDITDPNTHVTDSEPSEVATLIDRRLIQANLGRFTVGPRKIQNSTLSGWLSDTLIARTMQERFQRAKAAAMPVKATYKKRVSKTRHAKRR